MAYQVIVHIQNEDAFIAELDELPSPSDTVLVVKEPRKRDGKPLRYLDRDAMIVIYPWSRVTFLEILAEPTDEDDVIGIYR